MVAVVPYTIAGAFPPIAHAAGRTAARPVTDRRSVVETGILALIVLAILSAVFGGPEATPPGPVLIVGDSLMHQATDEMSAALAEDGWETRIEPHPGAGIRGGGYWGVDWPTHLDGITRQRDYEVAVVELGTNGCDGCASLPDAIDAVMRSLHNVDVVLWIDVRSQSPRPGELRAAEINEELARAPERWDNLDVVSLDDMLDQADVIDADGVHLTPAGQLVFAGEVRSELRDLADIDD